MSLDPEALFPHPREAASVRGHAAAERALLADWNAGRLPSAYLFAGPRGIGKAATAYRFARFILHASARGRDGAGGLFGDALPEAPPDSLDVSLDAPAVRRVVVGSHPDLLAIEPPLDKKKKTPKQEIPIEEARKIGGFLSLTGGEGAWRVVIVDAADQMNANAANAILKWLEEPPPQAIFLLVAHRAGALLPTIRSRCRMLAFAPPPREIFLEVVEAMFPDAAPAELDWLHRLSGGRPGLAATLRRQGAVTLYEELLRLAAELPATGEGALARFAEKAAGEKGGVDFANLALLLGRLAHGAATGGGEGAAEGERAAFARLRALKPLEYWLDLWEKGGRFLRDAERLYLDRRQAATVWLEAMAGRNNLLHEYK